MTTGPEAISRELSDRAVIRLSPEMPACVEEAVQLNDEEGGREEEEGVVPRLRSRVDQQSTLIAMLKQRSDETFRELQHYKALYEESSLKSHDLDTRLLETSKECSLVEKRFKVLAENHEEMIKIKDEYKSSNMRLREEINTLRQENETQFNSPVLEGLRKEIRRLEEDVRGGRRREKELEVRGREMEGKAGELEEELQREKTRVARETTQLEKRITAGLRVEEELGGLLRRRDAELQVLKEKSRELEDACTVRGEEIESRKVEQAQLETRLADAQQEGTRMREVFRAKADAVSRDEEVSHLRSELKVTQGRLNAVEKDFSAYRDHSAQLLHQERELNSQLRHLVE